MSLRDLSSELPCRGFMFEVFLFVLVFGIVSTKSYIKRFACCQSELLNSDEASWLSDKLSSLDLELSGITSGIIDTTFSDLLLLDMSSITRSGTPGFVEVNIVLTIIV